MPKCKVCYDSGIDSNLQKCTACSINAGPTFNITPWIPLQYQGNRYSSAALPLPMAEWAREMEVIRDDIAARTDLKNYLICSPYRTGKTVWSYDLISRLAYDGYDVHTIVDLLDIKRILYSYKEEDLTLLAKILNVPVLIVRIPQVLQYGIVETMQALLYRRVGVNGQTIFLYSDSYYNLSENCGRKEILQGLLGDGSLGSVKLKNYRRSKDGEQS